VKYFIAFVKKEFRHIFRDRRTLLILVGMPIAQILIFGYAITNEIKDAAIAIHDKSIDYQTREISNKLTASGYFVLKSDINDISQYEELFRLNAVKEIIVFEPNFAKNIGRGDKGKVHIITDASEPNTAAMLSSYTSGIINSYAANNILTQDQKDQGIRAETRMLYNPELKDVFMFIPGTMALILMLVSAMMTSVSIVREKELGTMEILLVSPLKPYHIILGKVVPYLLLAFLNAVVILLLGIFVFGLPIRGSILLLLFESLLYIMLALSLGIFISTIAKNQMMAMFISMFALMLPTTLLSGFIFPIENMPKILQYLTLVMPPRWYIVVAKAVMLKGASIFVIWKETFILIAMIFTFLTLSIIKFKERLN
jgi:ABC-type multidrug transport system, permease component